MYQDVVLLSGSSSTHSFGFMPKQLTTLVLLTASLASTLALVTWTIQQASGTDSAARRPRTISLLKKRGRNSLFNPPTNLWDIVDKCPNWMLLLWPHGWRHESPGWPLYTLEADVHMPRKRMGTFASIHTLVQRTFKLAGTNKYKDNSVQQRAGMRQKIWVVTTASSLRHPIKKTKGRLE